MRRRWKLGAVALLGLTGGVAWWLSGRRATTVDTSPSLSPEADSVALSQRADDLPRRPKAKHRVLRNFRDSFQGRTADFEVRVLADSRISPVLVVHPAGEGAPLEISGRHVLVTLPDDGSPEMLDSFGIPWERIEGLPRSFRILANDPESVPALLRRLSDSGQFRTVEPDPIARLAGVPDDPKFSEQWALNGAEGVGAVRAWDRVSDCSSVPLAVVDTGVSHPDIVPNLAVGWNVIDRNGNTADDNGHGTHVAGIVAAAGNNRTGVTGLCWRARVIPVKVLDADGRGEVSRVAEGYLKAMELGAKIVNASLGSGYPSTVERAALEKLAAANVLFVTAAGNDGQDIGFHPSYPAAYGYANILAVAATSSSGALASFSNFNSEKVHIAAPGRSILSTYPSTLDLVDFTGAPLDGLRLESGTSMASPLVAATAALIWSRVPTLGMAAVKSQILASADQIEGLRAYVQNGRRLNAAKAVALSRVAIEGLKSGAKVSPGESLEVAIDAESGEGAIVRVELLDGDMKLGDDAVAPYAVSFEPHEGVLNLKARLSLASGLSLDSEVVTVNVTRDMPVSFPLGDGIVVFQRAALTFEPAVRAYGGEISEVSLFDGERLVAEARVRPFSLSWSPDTAGDQVLVLKARDDLGSRMTVETRVRVEPATQRGTTCLARRNARILGGAVTPSVESCAAFCSPFFDLRSPAALQCQWGLRSVAMQVGCTP